EEDKEINESDVQPVNKRRRKSKAVENNRPRDLPTPAVMLETDIRPKASSTRKSVNLTSRREETPVEDEGSKAAEQEQSASEGEEDEKPELKKKRFKKVQATLKSSGNDLYPDWKPGEPVPYAA